MDIKVGSPGFDRVDNVRYAIVPRWREGPKICSIRLDDRRVDVEENSAALTRVSGAMDMRPCDSTSEIGIRKRNYR